ncbi:MAG: cyclic nucleotide-binding domain-containing protein [Candidatus Magnetomorum sp.]|nr:cyclic nucleotide-binding domain-containing protein [Candidatus Magnetomorum sp.]
MTVEELQQLDLFQELSYSEAAKVHAISKTARVNEGEPLFEMGNPAHTFFVILSGDFMIYFCDGTAFTLHQRGEITGWSTVVRPYQYTGTAVALTAGEVLTFDGSELLRLVQGDASLGDKLMGKVYANIGERIAFAQSRSTDVQNQ